MRNCIQISPTDVISKEGRERIQILILSTFNAKPLFRGLNPREFYYQSNKGFSII